MSRAPFPWPAAVAYATLIAAPWINRWLDRPPRPKPEPPAAHVTPTQVRIVRPSREIERGGS